MENKFYYIYEIWGEKIGCADNLERRIREQKIFDGRYDVLEVHTDIIVASKREIELQKQHGYKVDNIPYYKICDNVINSRDKIDWNKKIANTNFKAKTANTNYKSIMEKRSKTMNWDVVAEKVSKPINQYDKKGNFIQQFISATEAAKHVNGYNSNICCCLKGKQATSYGYKWEYAK